MPPQFIFEMHEVSKLYGDKVVIQDISLSFFCGAKIGMLGLNGSGKSSLLRILAGLDREFEGYVHFEPGYTVGLLPQEPQLDPSLNVKENVELAVMSTRKLLTDFDAISEKFAEPMEDDEMQKLLDKQAALQEKIDALDAWNLDRHLFHIRNSIQDLL